jgi:anionic cell wall polymer biosynthesis LytR-Cps2A-Psr (LCP) family protein
LVSRRGLRARYFLLSFAAAFFLWSVLYLLLAASARPDTAATAVNPVADLEDPYRPGPGDALTVLFMGMPGLRDTPGAYLLARFDPAGGRVAIAALPPHMQVLHSGKPESLTEVYAYGGVLYTRELLAKSLGITIDRYVRLTPEGFLRCAEAIGSVEHFLPAPLRLERDGARLELDRGLQLLDGNKALLLLRHAYGSTEERLSAQASLAAALTEQRRDVILSTLAESIFGEVINRIDSDISYTDYLERKAAGDYFARLPGPVTKIIAMSGSEQDGLYQASDTFIAELRRYF